MERGTAQLSGQAAGLPVEGTVAECSDSLAAALGIHAPHGPVVAASSTYPDPSNYLFSDNPFNLDVMRFPFGGWTLESRKYM